MANTPLVPINRKLQKLLADGNNHSQELDKCKRDPVYFYNNYVRKEGEKVLNAEEYKEYMKKVWEQRDKNIKDKDNASNRQ